MHGAIRSQPAATIQCPDRRIHTIFLSSPFDVFLPLQDAGTWLLTTIYGLVSHVSVFELVGAYGVAIIVMTIIIRLALAPLQQFQLLTQRKTMAEQRKLAPQVAELRKKYKKDTQRLNSEMMKLYQEHGVNPLGGLVGCLPLIVQMPILSALYFVFRFRAPHVIPTSHFLFLQNLNDIPLQHGVFAIAGFAIPALAYLVFPLLAAITTLIQTRMMQMPPPPNPTDQELQTLQMQRTMMFISPLFIGYFALTVPVALGLYWFIGNCVSIIQQSFVVGWGNLLPSRFRAAAGGTPPPPPSGGRLPGPQPGSNPRPKNGGNQKKPKRQTP